MTVHAEALFLDAPGRTEWRELDLAEPAAGEVCVRVAGCGVCHTDLSFYTGSVRTRRPLPLVLGHEISGVVEDAPPPFSHLLGRAVIVPAVLPCAACALCTAGRDTACTSQLMPGNDFHGGFATHVVVPARHLAVLDDLGGHRLEELSVIADAVTTPYQALKRACVNAGDLVVIVGVGGIGTYALQIALTLGAEVAAVDVSADRLDRASALGARWCFTAGDARAIKKTLAAESGTSTARWRILEMSGTVAGQELAWALLPPAGTIGVIGYTPDRPSIRLSNLMALDATAFGSWGCSPRHYPAVIELVVSGAVHVRPFIEPVPMAQAGDLLAAIAAGSHPARRPVLVPAS